ncbi:MAG: MBL fold metallo-hydrolase [Candidatus Marinimicrobia bacterium]|nr:MBL fold metallo-hydrolase [Candidatus Neomarinimicrobiota bacterium]
MNIRLNKSLSKTSKIILSTLMVLTGLTFTVNTVLSSAKYPDGATPLHKINASPQNTGKKFTNPRAWKERPSFKTMTEFMFGKNQRTPKATLPQQTIELSHFESADTNQLNVTNIGHSSLMINIDGYRILTDPVLEPKLTLLGPTRFNKEIPLDINQLQDIDYVLISHNHYDHLNKFSIQFLNDRVGHFVVPLAVGAQLEKWGVPQEQITELDWWDELQLTDDLLVVATPAQHFSGRGLLDRDKTLWASYVIGTNQPRVYFGGDSGYFNGFKQIGDKYGPFDITFLECGAYNKGWSFIHMFPEETAQAALDLQAKYLFPIHWGAFNLSLHDWFDPMQRVKIAAQELGIPLLTPIFGQTLYYPDDLNTVDWWTPFVTAKP